MCACVRACVFFSCRIHMGWHFVHECMKLECEWQSAKFRTKKKQDERKKVISIERLKFVEYGSVMLFSSTHSGFFSLFYSLVCCCCCCTLNIQLHCIRSICSSFLNENSRWYAHLNRVHRNTVEVHAVKVFSNPQRSAAATPTKAENKDRLLPYASHKFKVDT